MSPARGMTSAYPFSSFQPSGVRASGSFTIRARASSVVVRPAPPPAGRIDLNAQSALDGVDGAHLIGYGTDPANARGNIGNLRAVPAAQKRLEQARRLEDLELDVLDLVAFQLDVEPSLAFHPRQVIHPDGLAAPAHARSHSSLAFRNCHAQAL